MQSSNRDNHDIDQTDDKNEFLSDNLKCTMYIPKELAGKVIGKKGDVVSRIMKETHVLKICALNPVGNSLWVAIDIIGQPSAISLAYKSILDMVQEVDGVIIEFPIQRGKHFFLFNSTGFKTIQHISATTNVRINIPGLEGMTSSNPQVGTLEGKCSDTLEAFDMLCQAHKEAYALSASRRHLHQEDKKDKLRNSNQESKEDKKDKLRNSNQASKLQQINSKITINQVKQKIETTSFVIETKEMNNNNNNNNNIKDIKYPDTLNSMDNSASLCKNQGKYTQNQTKGQKVEEIAKKIETSQLQTTSVTYTSPSIALDKTNLDKNEVKESNESKIILNVSIPSNIVGILLVKRNDSDVKYSVLNQIQNFTKTRISRVDPPPSRSTVVMTSVSDVSSKLLLDIDDIKNKPNKKQSKSNQRRRNSEDDEDNSCDNNNSDCDSSSDDSDDYVDAKEIPNNLQKETKPANEITDVPFVIVGSTQDSVDTASVYIKRIISGERIKDVLSTLNLLPIRTYIKKQSNIRVLDKNIARVKPNKQKNEKNVDETVNNIVENATNAPFVKKSVVKKDIKDNAPRKDKSDKTKVDNVSNPTNSTATPIPTSTTKKQYPKKKVIEIIPQKSKP